MSIRFEPKGGFVTGDEGFVTGVSRVETLKNSRDINVVTGVTGVTGDFL
jgi:hypothetical protein